jgi:uncharacterized protein
VLQHNPSRYAYTAAQMLANKNIDFVPVGIKTGYVFGKEILDLNNKPVIEDVDTITLYLGPVNQKEWIEYIISLNPKRIIFNPWNRKSRIFQKSKRKQN